jgi:hypothetical protein
MIPICGFVPGTSQCPTARSVDPDVENKCNARTFDHLEVAFLDWSNLIPPQRDRSATRGIMDR